VIADALAVLDFYLAHRRERLEQVRAALAELREEARATRQVHGGGGDAEIDEAALPRLVVERVYADVDPVLWGAAELSVRAQLDYLHPR
jgi:hypothetical protein